MSNENRWREYESILEELILMQPDPAKKAEWQATLDKLRKTWAEAAQMGISKGPMTKGTLAKVKAAAAELKADYTQ